MGGLRPHSACERAGWPLPRGRAGDGGGRVDHGRRGGRGAVRAARGGTMRRRLGHATPAGLQACAPAAHEDGALL